MTYSWSDIAKVFCLLIVFLLLTWYLISNVQKRGYRLNWLKWLLLNGWFFAVLIVGGEAVCKLLIKVRPSGSSVTTSTRETGGVKKLHLENDLLGYVMKPDTSVTSVLIWGNDTVWKARYATDAYGRRRVPLSADSSRTGTILMFGCSVTFGSGLNDDETLPYFLGLNMKDYQVYNYADMGYGTQQMLAILEKTDLHTQVSLSSEPPVLVYVFIDPHIERNIGSMYVYNKWGSNMPYYERSSDGIPVRKGSFRTGRKGRSYFYHILGKSNIARFLNINEIHKVNHDDYIFTADLIARARDLFKERYGSDRFYVMIAAASLRDPTFPDELKARNIRYFRYEDRLEGNRADYEFPHDGHPNRKWTEAIAGFLAADLKQELKHADSP
ncbi:MAG: hypothetical protein H6585_04395 [Flavobacteriales bacterium]|nr:hypothetical protein [Flavobacteriales bacterium]MCB9447566.1 hypothetical protein [Flavobacteriales bacterium]